MNEIAVLLTRARAALAESDDAVMRVTLTRLFTLTDPPPNPGAMLARGQAACIAASYGLHVREWGTALRFVNDACLMLDILDELPEAFDLGLDILAIPKRWPPTAMDAIPWHIFSTQVRWAIGVHSGDVVLLDDDAEPFHCVIEQICAVPLGAPLALRVLLASTLLVIGYAASEAGEMGRAIAAYEACRRFADSMQERIALLLGVEMYPLSCSNTSAVAISRVCARPVRGIWLC